MIVSDNQNKYMKKENTTPQEEEEKPVIDLGTNAEFVVTYKTIRLSNGKSVQIQRKELIEPELPERKRRVKKAGQGGRGRPPKKKAKVSMEENTSLDMDSLLAQAKDKVD